MGPPGRRLSGVWLLSSGTFGSGCGPESGLRRMPSRIVGVRRSLAGSMWFLPRDLQRRRLLLVTDRPRRRRMPAASSHREHAARGCWTQSSACPPGSRNFSSLSRRGEVSPQTSLRVLPGAWQPEACSGIVMAVAGRCWGWGRGRTLQRVVPTCRVESSALWVLTVVAMPSSCLASVSSGCAPTAKAGRSQLNQRWTCYRNMMISKSNRGVRMGFRLRPRPGGRRQTATTATTATVGGSMEPNPREPDMYGNQSVLLRTIRLARSGL